MLAGFHPVLLDRKVGRMFEQSPLERDCCLVPTLDYRSMDVRAAVNGIPCHKDPCAGLVYLLEGCRVDAAVRLDITLEAALPQFLVQRHHPWNNLGHEFLAGKAGVD